MRHGCRQRQPCPSRAAGTAVTPQSDRWTRSRNALLSLPVLPQSSQSPVRLFGGGMHAIGGSQLYPHPAIMSYLSQSQNQQPQSSPGHHSGLFPGQFPGPSPTPFLSPYHHSFAGQPFLQSFHSSAWDPIPGHEPLALMMLTQRSSAHLSLPTPSSSPQFLPFHRPAETSDESRSYVHPFPGSSSDHHPAPLFYPFAPSSRHPITMSSLLSPHLLHPPHLHHYEQPVKSAIGPESASSQPPLSPLFFDFGHRSAMRFTPSSCAPPAAFGKESAAPLRSPSPKPAISTALAGPAKQDDKASLPTNQLTTCSSSLKEQKGSVMTSIENHVTATTAAAAAAIPAIPTTADTAIADVPQAGIRKDESDKSNSHSGKRVAKSVSVGNDENEERQIGESGEAGASASVVPATECSGSVHQHQLIHSSLKLLKDFKIPPKHADPVSPQPTAGKGKPVPAPETRTIEVQCDGPDWTPVVLKSQIKNRLLKVGEKRKKKEKAGDEASASASATASVKKSRNTGTGESDAVASAGSGKRKSGTKGAQHKLLSHKMPAVADPAAGCSSSIGTDCSKRLQAETASQSQVLSHQHRQSSPKAEEASPRNASSRNQQPEKQALVKSEKKKRKDRISGEQQENKCERKGKAATSDAVTGRETTGREQRASDVPGDVPGDVLGDMPCPKAAPKKAAPATRRRRFRSGLDMIRQPKKKKVRTGTGIGTPESSKTSQDGTAGLSSETRKLMANKASGETVLHRAARQGYADVVISCMESRTCDINARDFAGYTPLHECCSSGHWDIARMLLSHGADPNACAARGIRVLHDAIECDRVQVVRLLLAYGADPTICTYKGTTPLELAQSKAMLQLLRGVLSDLNGDGDEETAQWKFSDCQSAGRDVFDEPAPDCDALVAEPGDVVIEESASPLCDSFTLPLDGAAVTVLRLSDVLTQLAVTRTEFCQRYDRVQIVSVPQEEFESKATCNQLLGFGKKIKSEAACKVELVRLNDDVRAMLGIERTRVPSLPSAAPDETRKLRL